MNTKLVIRPLRVADESSDDAAAYSEGGEDILGELAARIKKGVPDIDVSIEEDDPDVERLRLDNECLRKAIEAVVRGAMNAERESCAKVAESCAVGLHGNADARAKEIAAKIRARK